MLATHSEWYRTLAPGKKQAIRDLHRVNPYWNLVGPLFVTLWILTATAMMYLPPHLLVRIPGYLLIGVLIHGMANFMHEGIHGTLFKHHRWDRWYGFLMAAPALFSITAYGVNHLLHHRHNRTPDDPDEFTNVTKNGFLLTVFYYLWIVVGMFIYLVRVPCVAIVEGSNRERKRILVEYSLILLVLAGIASLAWLNGYLELMVHFWLIPLLVAAFLGNVRGWAEHTGTRPGHPLTETRTVTSNRLLSFLNINLNYHLEHHLFPGVPWYNLPKVHRILLDDYKAAGASVYDSYTRFIVHAFFRGLRGASSAHDRKSAIAPDKAA